MSDLGNSERPSRRDGYTSVNQVEDDVGSPPSYEAASSSTAAVTEVTDLPNRERGNEKKSQQLPSYELATTLPTYEDVQEMKEDEARNEVVEMIFGNANQDEIYVDGVAVGTDCMFIFAFLLSFFFSWLGFFVGFCILMNLAGRYGAMSGLGLSVINWLFYVKYLHYDDKNVMTQERILLWWIFIFAAVFITLKGFVNWFQARKLLDMSPEERENGRVMVLY